MSEIEWEKFSCDLCGSDNAEEIPAIHEYQPDQPVHVCRDCGFVYVPKRRSAKAIADSWSDELYEHAYTAGIPAVKARQLYVADFIHSAIGLKGKALCDIGGGEGQFLDMARNPAYGARVFAIEPSERNCGQMGEMSIECYHGTVEDFNQDPAERKRRFDIVTIMWTLEACRSCRDMLDAAYGVLGEGGHIAIATGSRILVPFKKPLHYYVGNDKWGDTHPFRFSANTLRALLAVSGFAPIHINRHFDTDYLVVIAQKTDRTKDIPWEKDDYREVIDFFDRWHRETQAHFTHF